MQNTPQKIHSQYVKGCDFKSALGAKGMFEQNKINERFYIGDQWYGAKCGNDRPLVRHNVIKRIADYKISTVLNNPLNVIYSADGVPSVANEGDSITDLSVKEINNIKIGIVNFTYETQAVIEGRKYLNGLLLAKEAESLVNTFSYQNINAFYTTAKEVIKNMKRDDQGHVISNDETDGQKCQHQSGGNNRQDIQNKLDAARANLKKVNDNRKTDVVKGGGKTALYV